jgi:hypothetical protein
MEQELKLHIQKWLKKDPDYISGLGLLIQVCKNKTLLRNLSRRETPINLKKIAWELKKSIGATKLYSPNKNKLQKVSVGSFSAGKKLKEKTTTYPEIIETIISRNGKLNNNRDILHRELKTIPETNTEDNKTKRKEILEKIKTISNQLDHLYKLKDRFFKEEIIPTEDELKFPQVEMIKKKEEMKVNPIDQMSEADLLKKRTNLRSNLTKKKNKLLYQTISNKILCQREANVIFCKNKSLMITSF